MIKALVAQLEVAGATKCSHCAVGWRHPVGNCVCCGWGPSPLAVEHLPANNAEYERALTGLLNSLNRKPNYDILQTMLLEWYAGTEPPIALAAKIIKRFGS